MMQKKYLLPLWLRFWHWLNALLFIVLIITGISIHYSGTWTLIIQFSKAVPVHNVTGLLLILSYLYYIIFSIIKGNWKQYIPKFKIIRKDFKVIVKYYTLEIFYKKGKPHKPTEIDKFNPLQKIAYLGIMCILMPIIIITGLFLMFPELAPDEILGMGGIWPMAMLHAIFGFILTIFMVGHIYLGTTGDSASQLFRAMFTGWYVYDEKLHQNFDSETKNLMPDGSKSKVKEKGKLLPSIFYNPITFAGAFIALITFLTILFLIIVEFIVENQNPYAGVITFIVLPGIMIMGILLIFIGVFWENRRIIRSQFDTKKLPIIDMNNPKHQLATLFVSIGGLILIIFSAFGSYKAFEYSESIEFCGTLCHSVMKPEYVTYGRSPHGNVPCIKCHIGPGADWFIRSKISGLYQVYRVLTNSYPTPIPTPIEHLRPAQQTCEQCHWPKNFFNEKKIKRDYYLPDENNTKFSLEMSVKVGGGNQEIGNTSGIHWHMNLNNDIQYYATDEKRQVIPWFKVKSKLTGKETVYSTTDFKTDIVSLENSKKIRTFDCIDCHNRPTHILYPAPQIVNLFMSMGRIDPKIPSIKSIATQALESRIVNSSDAFNVISNFIWGYYNNLYPNISDSLKTSIGKTIEELAYIYSVNYFPEMKMNWHEFPNNLGHLYSSGCFRCHDGKHISNEGKVLNKDCNLCHTFKTEIIPSDPSNFKQSVIVNDFIHPGGDDKQIQELNCVFCHGSPKINFQKENFIQSLQNDNDAKK